MQKAQEWGQATLLQMGGLERAFLWRGRAWGSIWGHWRKAETTERPPGRNVCSRKAGP